MPEHIGQTIKKLREERKLSKARLAREAGFSDAYLVQIEKGDRTPSRSVLEAIARAMKVPRYHLFIAAGIYNKDDMMDAAEYAEDAVKRAEEHLERALTGDERSRYFALGLEEAEHRRTREYLGDVDAHEREMIGSIREGDPLALSDDLFWGWTPADSSWAPEHWSALTERDRKLVQQLINRLIQLAD